MNQSIQLKHNIGNDPLFSKWRKKFYSDLPPKLVANKLNKPLTELCVNSISEDGLLINSILTPGSYFSPAFDNENDWTPSDFDLFFHSLQKTKPWDMCRLLMLNSKTLAELQNRCKKKFLPYLMTEYQFRIIPGKLSFQEYLKTRSSKFNANQRRCMRHFETNGLSFTYEIDFSEIVKIYKNRNEKKGEGDYSVTDEFINMLEGIRKDFQAAGRWYEIGIRNAEGRLCAFALGPWDEDRTYYLFQTAHDPEFHHLRLGAMVFDKLIEDILTQGCSYLSFMSNSDYLENFTSYIFKFNRIDIHNHTLKGLILYLRRKIGQMRKQTKVHSKDPQVALEATST